MGKYFLGFRRLKHIFLSYNQLNTFPILPTRVQRSLTTWHLDGNQITSLDIRAFSWFHVLVKLHLSHNKVRHFNTSIINKMPKLHDLKLHGNHLQSVDNLFMDAQPIVHLHVTLEENPRDCDSRLAWITDYVRRGRVLGDPAYSKPSCLRGTLIGDIST